MAGLVPATHVFLLDNERSRVPPWVIPDRVRVARRAKADRVIRDPTQDSWREAPHIMRDEGRTRSCLQLGDSQISN